MGTDRGDLWTVGLTFGVVGALLSLTWAVGYGGSVPQADQSVPLGLVVVVSTVVTAIVGATTWAMVVNKLERWSTPAHGAIAGAVTIWGSLVVIVPSVVFIDQAGTHSLSVTSVLETLMLGVFMGTVGMVFVGVFLLPVGILTGYYLGRRLTQNPGPVPVLSRIT